MLAAVYSKDAPEGVKLSQVSRPKVSWYKKLLCKHWVECKVMSVGVNPVDAKFLYADKLPPAMMPFVQMVVENRVVGIDFSGVVTKAESDSGFQPGDEVFGTVPPYLCGSFGEYLVAPADRIYYKPQNVSFSEACALPLVSITGFQSFENLGLSAGHNVLVIGASGGTGHFAVQIAKIKNARVTAICSKRNKEFVRSLGADEVIAYDECDDIISALQQSVAQQGKFDFVFDSVSSHDPQDAKYSYEYRIKSATPLVLSETSMYLFIGGQLKDWLLAHLKRFTGINLFAKGRELFWIYLPNTQGYLARIKDYTERDDLKVTIAHQFPFTDEGVQNAFRSLLNRRTVGKVVIQVTAD